MSCHHPIKALKTAEGVIFNAHITNLELPCGACVGCRMRRAQDWKIRCLHEAQMHKENCFITLTYARDRLPPNASLHHKDFQDFMKRMRHNAAPGLRFYMCGEYGPLNGRPHYHANIFGKDFRDRTEAGNSKSQEPFYTSEELTKLWKHGRATVQDLTPETAGYTTGYIMKKILGKGSKEAYNIFDVTTGETIERIPEYNRMSNGKGIGETWYKKFHTDITRYDIAVAAGREHQVPKYYDKLAERYGHADIDMVKSKRIAKAKAIDPIERTQARRNDKEQVQLARLRNHERSNEL